MPDNSKQSPSRPKRIAWIFREPILHFALAAGVLFGAQRWHQAKSKQVIQVDESLLKNLARDFEQRYAKMPSRQKWDETGKILAEEELLFREAQARGMTSDNRVRGALIELMRAALAPPLPTPSDAELESMRPKLPETSRILPPQVAFEHLSFTSADRVPQGLLDRLRAGGDPGTAGDSVQLPNPLPLSFRPQLERMMGADFTSRAFELPVGQWEGPITSSRGIHFTRISQHEPSRELPFVELRPMLQMEWNREQRRLAIEGELRKLSDKYQVIIPPAPANLPQ